MDELDQINLLEKERENYLFYVSGIADLLLDFHDFLVISIEITRESVLGSVEGIADSVELRLDCILLSTAIHNDED